MAAKARLSERLVLRTALETVELFHDAWKKEKTHLPLSKPVIDAVETQLRIIPLGRRAAA